MMDQRSVFKIMFIFGLLVGTQSCILTRLSNTEWLLTTYNLSAATYVTPERNDALGIAPFIRLGKTNIFGKSLTKWNNGCNYYNSFVQINNISRRIQMNVARAESTTLDCYDSIQSKQNLRLQSIFDQKPIQYRVISEYKYTLDNLHEHKAEGTIIQKYQDKHLALKKRAKKLKGRYRIALHERSKDERDSRTEIERLEGKIASTTDKAKRQQMNVELDKLRAARATKRDSLTEIVELAQLHLEDTLYLLKKRRLELRSKLDNDWRRVASYAERRKLLFK